MANRKRNSKPAPPPEYVPTFEECVAMLSRTLSIMGVAGIKMEWANHNGNLVITFRGMVIETNSRTGEAHIIQSSNLVDNAVKRVSKKGA